MSNAVQSPDHPISRSPDRIAHPATRKTITWLQLNWKGVEAKLGDGGADSKSARLAHAASILQRPVATFNDLSQAEADRLVLSYKQELGEEFKPAGYQGARRWSRPRPSNMEVDGLILVRIGEMSSELWEGDWGAMLERRVCERFGVADARALTPSQARSMVEELLQRIFVRDCRASGYTGEIPRTMIERGKEYLRAKFFIHIDRHDSQDEG
jgi:hypothetical protein